MAVKNLWKSHSQGYQDALVYMVGRQAGYIKSIKTPWQRFNDATTDGIEWNSLTVIGGRPGSGKTLIKDQIIREALVLNSDQEFRVLEFQFEMIARTTAIREYSSIIGKSYKYLCSADKDLGTLSQEDLNLCMSHADKKKSYPCDIVDTPLTVQEIKDQIVNYMEAHCRIDKLGAKVYVNTIVTLDHTILIKKSAGERDKIEMLYNFGEVLTELKRKYPIAFIILSQLNRNIDNPERSEDGKYGNYILESDIFGSDAMLQHADTLIGINRPGKQKIKFYGPDRFIIDDDKVLVMHFLKCRNGDTRMSFFRAEFEKMRIVETAPPMMAQKRMSTY